MDNKKHMTGEGKRIFTSGAQDVALERRKKKQDRNKIICMYVILLFPLLNGTWSPTEKKKKMGKLLTVQEILLAILISKTKSQYNMDEKGYLTSNLYKMDDEKEY